MKVFQELDEWAYDIEKEYKETGNITPKIKRQYNNICTIRDRLYDEHCERVKKRNQLGGVQQAVGFKYCKKRLIPPGHKKS